MNKTIGTVVALATLIGMAFGASQYFVPAKAYAQDQAEIQNQHLRLERGSNEIYLEQLYDKMQRASKEGDTARASDIMVTISKVESRQEAINSALYRD